ncbi:sugar ABC transporter permease [Paenibacillus sp. BC26]|uniref:ABC transporter permease n=1 Tax=Paenibacillus sp. BC26 TaxID=1881032 RepID=UPI0008E4608C|nr:ABC transporter permease subunit [Paenibacillus sp. BC26]SFS57794.1 putative aldouronate transport system permease protein [Paenibacillus sp. BC26]
MSAARKETMSMYANVWKTMKKSPFLFLMAVPGMLFLFLFNYVPLYGILIAFKNFNISKGILGSEWVGFKNFEFFLSSDKLFLVVKNTLFLNALFIGATTVFAIAIALLLNEIRVQWFKRVSQSLIFLPYFMSWVVISMIVNAFLGGQEPTLNHWLTSLHLPEVNWYFNAELWPYILTVIRVWQGAGYLAIIYLAAISGIPEDMYEAARIDGASRFQIMRRITLPLLTPTVSILILLAVGRIFNADFGMIYAIIQDNSILFPTTDVIDTFVYRSMRQLHDFGMSSAVGLFQSVMGFLFVLLANGIVKRFSRDSALF